MVLLLYNFYSLHCPLSGPDLIYISLLIIPCIIYYMTVMITYNIYIVIRETGQFSSKGIINDFIGNLNRLTVSRRFTEQAV